MTCCKKVVLAKDNPVSLPSLIRCEKRSHLSKLSGKLGSDTESSLCCCGRGQRADEGEQREREREGDYCHIVPVMSIQAATSAEEEEEKVLFPLSRDGWYSD